jgi:DNA-binding NtrC family response regulator
MRRTGRTTTPAPRLLGAATPQLEAAMRAGRFRHDLYFRVGVVTVVLPPLRARPDELPALTDRLVAHYATWCGRAPMAVTAEARRALAHYDWPGNVRQLAAVLERAVACAQGAAIGEAELPAYVAAPERLHAPTDGGTLGELERLRGPPGNDRIADAPRGGRAARHRPDEPVANAEALATGVSGRSAQTAESAIGRVTRMLGATRSSSAAERRQGARSSAACMSWPRHAALVQ